MGTFGILRKFAWMPLAVVPLLEGCEELLREDVVGRGYYVISLGFASDTTAIMLKQYWEDTEDCGVATCWGSKSDKEVELQLMDVRFKKVYWSSGKVRNKYGNLGAAQWNDSTMFIDGDDYWLWTIGYSRPRKITLNGNVIVGAYHRWLRLRNDSILAYNARENIIIDTKTNTMNNWDPPDEYKWVVTHSEKMLWEGGYLMNDGDSCRLSLLSGNGDTLSNVVYCKNLVKCRTGEAVYRYFIRVSNPVGDGRYYDYWPADYAYFRYDEKGNIAQRSSFWIKNIRNEMGYIKSIEFIDSLGNITEY